MKKPSGPQKRKPAVAYSYRDDPAISVFPDDKPVIVYDGYCALCTGWVRYVLRHDRQGHYRFLAAQSPLGQALYVHYGLNPLDYETNILIADGMAYYKSEASIRMAEGLGFPSSLARAFRILPLKWRDRLYDFVARNRLRIFGELDSCHVAAPDHRFIA